MRLLCRSLKPWHWRWLIFCTVSLAAGVSLNLAYGGQPAYRAPEKLSGATGGLHLWINEGPLLSYTLYFVLYCFTFGLAAARISPAYLRPVGDWLLFLFVYGAVWYGFGSFITCVCRAG